MGVRAFLLACAWVLGWVLVDVAGCVPGGGGFGGFGVAVGSVGTNPSWMLTNSEAVAGADQGVAGRDVPLRLPGAWYDPSGPQLESSLAGIYPKTLL